MIGNKELLFLVRPAGVIELQIGDFGISPDQVRIRQGDHWYYFSWHGESVCVTDSESDRVVAYDNILERKAAGRLFDLYRTELQDLMTVLATTRVIQGNGRRATFAVGTCILTGKSIEVGDFITHWDKPEGWALTAYAVCRSNGHWGSGTWDEPDLEAGNLAWIEKLRVVMRDKSDAKD